MSKRLILGLAAVGVVAGGALWWHRHKSRTGLGLARLRKKGAPKHCPLLQVEDAGRQTAEFWEHAFVDVTECPVRGLDIDKLPSHVRPFADFMLRQRRRKLTPRDVAKAYLLTVASVQRGAISAAKLKEAWPDAPFSGGKVRPEDAMGRLLLTPAGQAYLRAASVGQFDAQAAETLRRRLAPFGLANRLGDQLQLATRLGQRAADVQQHVRRDTPTQWSRFVEREVPHIGPAKAGFFSALMGRGDLPTADAKELEFWLCRVGDWDRNKMRCKVPVKHVSDPPPESLVHEIRPKLAERLAAMQIAMPKKYQPFYQHLAHHAVWDKIGGTQTTHQAMIDAMERA